MEFNQKLQDYTRAEFEYYVREIYNVEGALDEHNERVRHFDQVVGHPQGADLLFYPDAALHELNKEQGWYE